MKTAYPNRENCSQEELEKYISRVKNSREQRRLMAINMLWLGLDALAVAKCLCVSDVSVYSWILRFNSKGLDGLLSRQRGGRPRLVSAAEIREHLNVFEQPQLAKETHWTAKKFHGYLKDKVQKEFSYQTTLNYLHEQDYKLKYGRSWPLEPEDNEQRRQEFKLKIKELGADTGIKIWYMDEAGFDGDPRPRRCWYKKGERKRIYRTQKHLRMSISGMCCPETGEFFALEFPYSDRETLQCLLNAANKELTAGANKREIIVLDNASWHKVKSLNWGRFEPLFLPPYSPDLNPIERIWAYLKEHYFHCFTAKNLQELIDQLDFALTDIWNSNNTVSSITMKQEN
jgi:transposase